MNKTRGSYVLFMLSSLFFMWGLLTSLNDILVPHLQAAFDLAHWQAQLVQFFFFAAYFVMSFPAGWLIRRWGYRRGIVLGLGAMGLGCLLFLPATYVQLYPLFLLALFVLASGITLLQVAANPYVAVVGPEDRAASRLNLAQGFNSLGHTIAPLAGAWLILQNTVQVSLESLRLPYVAIGLSLLALAMIFSRLPLPGIHTENIDKTGFRLKDHPGLIAGALAIFCYVGAEISVGSHLVAYFKAKEGLRLSTQTAGSYVAFYWGGAMIGRFLGALFLQTDRPHRHTTWWLKTAAIPLGAWLLIAAVWTSRQLPTDALPGIGIVLCLNYGFFALGKNSSAHMLARFATANALLILCSMITTGQWALWTVLSVGLFNSIMWSNIFTESIRGLGKFTPYGSSLLVMMIVGGAVIPVIQGLTADKLGINASFAVPAAAYLYLVVFAGMKIYAARPHTTNH